MDTADATGTGVLKLLKPVDFETLAVNPIEVHVRARDNGGPVPLDSAPAMVRVFVVDKNEPPAFEDERLEFSAPENEDYASAAVTGTDLDAGDGAALTYAVVDGNGQGLLALDPADNKVKALGSSLDFEQPNREW